MEGGNEGFRVGDLQGGEGGDEVVGEEGGVRCREGLESLGVGGGKSLWCAAVSLDIQQPKANNQAVMVGMSA